MRKAIIVAAFLASLGVSDTKGAASEGSTYNRLACRQACEQIGIWDAAQEVRNRLVNACKIGCNLGQKYCS